MTKLVFSLVIVTTVLCLSCSTKESSMVGGLEGEAPPLEDEHIQYYQSPDLHWLGYVDPKAEANIAVQKGDFRLLGFAGRAMTFPGIDDDIHRLQQHCGYQLLANSSDALTIGTGLDSRKKLYDYAATYNQIVSGACYKNRQTITNE